MAESALLASHRNVIESEGVMCRLMGRTYGTGYRNPLISKGKLPLIPDRELKPSQSLALSGNLEHEYRRSTINTFGGGVVEVLRGLVATHGLGMPTHR